MLILRSLSALVAGQSITSDIAFYTDTTLAATIDATTQTSPVSLVSDLLPLIIDLRIFIVTPEYTWISETAARAIASATAAREYESVTPVLTIENRTGTEIISLPYEVKPYPF